MLRLRDTNPPSGSPEAELKAAIAAMDPVVVTSARQQRILAAVRAHGRRRRWTAGVLLRPAIAAAILLGAGVAAAAAAVGHSWIEREWHELLGTPEPVVTAPARPVPTRSPPALVEPVSAGSSVALEPTAPAPPAITHVPARPRPGKGEDPSSLVEAVRALRGDHDARRAARLLDRYMRRYPRGSLAEEALALQIEAATALKSPRAAGFADRYLRLYPEGRFRSVARQALGAAREATPPP